LVFGVPIGGAAAGGDEDTAAGGHHDRAVFPLAIPTIAGPATMLTVLLLTDNARFDIGQRLEIAAVLAVVLAMTLLMLLLAGPIMRLLGRTGTLVVGRVMGLILASLATDNAMNAIAALFRAP